MCRSYPRPFSSAVSSSDWPVGFGVLEVEWCIWGPVKGARAQLVKQGERSTGRTCVRYTWSSTQIGGLYIANDREIWDLLFSRDPFSIACRNRSRMR